MLQRDDNKMPADNGRFCEMAAVTPQKVQCEIGSYYPAGSSVKPPPRQAAGTEKIVKNAHQELEAKTGKSVVTGENLLPPAKNK